MPLRVAVLAMALVLSFWATLDASRPACAAPPNSPMSNPELSPPEIPVKPKQVTALYKCTGYYNSYDCKTTLWLNGCEHSISVVWGPLLLPGSPEWAKLHRNWCSVTYDGAEVREERKLEPEKCDGLMRLLAVAFQGFPEVKWQDAKCTNMASPDGVLYESQRYHAPGHPDLFHVPAPDPDPEPRAVRLEDVSACELHTTVKKRRYVRCPVLVPEVYSWLRKVLAFVDVGLVIQNKMEPKERREPPEPGSEDRYVPGDESWQEAPPWRLSLEFGASFVNQSVGGSDDSGSGFLFGGEVVYEPHPLFGIAAVFEGGRHAAAVSTLSDSELAFLIVPRFHRTFWGKTVIWAGVGVGYIDTFLTGTAFTAGPATGGVDSHEFSFAVSPRVGADFRLASVWVGLEFMYLQSTNAINGTVTDSNNSALKGNFNFTPAWWGATARLGFDI